MPEQKEETKIHIWKTEETETQVSPSESVLAISPFLCTFVALMLLRMNIFIWRPLSEDPRTPSKDTYKREPREAARNNRGSCGCT